MSGMITPPTGAELQGPILSDFEPKARLIATVTNARFAEVTTTEDHGYSTGFVVRVDVPLIYGMGQDLYEQTSIVVTGGTTFTTDLDTTELNPFVAPSYPPAFTAAQVIPITGLTRNIAGGNGP